MHCCRACFITERGWRGNVWPYETSPRRRFSTFHINKRTKKITTKTTTTAKNNNDGVGRNVSVGSCGMSDASGRGGGSDVGADLSASEEDELFLGLLNYCGSDQALPLAIERQLDDLSAESVRAVVSRTKEGNAPLFVACKKDKAEAVELLLSRCGADVEQRGVIVVSHYLAHKYRYCITHMPSVTHAHRVTPLWYAAHTAKAAVVERLLRHDADPNSACWLGSTCIHLMHGARDEPGGNDDVSDAVDGGRAATTTGSGGDDDEEDGGADADERSFRRLTDNSDALSWPEYDGKTCLMAAVHEPDVCRLLLQHGANVNARDYRRNTALHHAIDKGRKETAMLLLDHYADPTAVNDDGDDALRSACLSGAKDVFIHLVDTVEYANDRILDACELMGATLLVQDDLATALQFWETVLEKRGRMNAPLAEPKSYFWQQLFDNTHATVDSNVLEDLVMDQAALHNQALRICERILGPLHERFIGRLEYDGFSPAYTHKLERHYSQVLKRAHRLSDFRHYATELILRKDGVLTDRACCTLRFFLWCCFRIAPGPGRLVGEINDAVDFKQVTTLVELLKDKLLEGAELLAARPYSRRQRLIADHALAMLTYLLVVLLDKADSDERALRARHLVKQLVLADPTTNRAGDHLLHLAASRKNVFPLSDMADDRLALFPSLRVARTLLECGADVNAVNKRRQSPLLVAASCDNFTDDLVRLLLDHGAHLDQADGEGLRADCLLLSYSDLRLNALDHVNLQCLAARVLKKHGLPYSGAVSAKMEHFVNLH